VLALMPGPRDKKYLSLPVPTGCSKKQ
jgi:hypothetical protein